MGQWESPRRGLKSLPLSPTTWIIACIFVSLLPRGTPSGSGGHGPGWPWCGLHWWIWQDVWYGPHGHPRSDGAGSSHYRQGWHPRSTECPLQCFGSSQPRLWQGQWNQALNHCPHLHLVLLDNWTEKFSLDNPGRQQTKDQSKLIIFRPSCCCPWFRAMVPHPLIHIRIPWKVT